MKPKAPLAAFTLLGLLLAPGCTVAPARADADPPSLVVVVVVDQLRADLVQRYDGVFTGGIRRLLDQGLQFSNATFDHAGTSTAPGHGSASTGTHPNRHGLVGNSWRERNAEGVWEEVYALRDLSAPIVGLPDREGRGPANLNRSGLADWLSAHDPEARIVSLSGKDRSAIAMAGQGGGEVYWMDPEHGRFLTSTHYRDDYPAWLDSFHETGLARSWSEVVWESTIPPRAELLSRPDTFPYEGDGVNTHFPHHMDREVPEGGLPELNQWRSRGPYPDAAVLHLAAEALVNLELGQRGSTDYLALALSQVDRVGHAYGPLSREQLDNLLRLDRELGAFFDLLDRDVGAGRWLLGLTADHGVLELPEYLAEMGEPGRRITPSERGELVRSAEAAALAAGTEPVARAQAAARAALDFEWVADAFPWAEVLSSPPQDSLRALYARSYHPDRAIGELGHLGVAIRLPEGTYMGSWPTGTGHGTPYHHDRHVPLILMGAGISAGVDARRASVVDLAPTLALLAGVPFPADLDGSPLLGGGPSPVP